MQPADLRNQPVPPSSKPTLDRHYTVKRPTDERARVCDRGVHITNTLYS